MQLSEIGSLRGGNGFPTRLQGGKAGIPFYKVSDMNTEGNETFMSDSNNYVTAELASKLGASVIPAGGIIFAKVGAAIFLERKRILTEPSCIDNNLMALSPDVRKVDTRFLHFLLSETRLSDHSESTALPALNGGTISAIQILLPPVDEQRVIAATLADALEEVTQLDTLIAKKKAIRAAATQMLFSEGSKLANLKSEWTLVRLGDIGYAYSGLAGKSGQDFGHGNGRYIPFVNVMANPILNCSWIESVKIGPDELQKEVSIGDILFNASSETPEEVALASAVNEDIAGLYLNSFCFGFRATTAGVINPSYFAYFSRSDVGRSVITPMAQGSTRYNIGKQALLATAFMVPSFEEQSAVAEILVDMDSEIGALEAQREKVEMIRRGMMADLLSGKVRLA